MASDVYIWCTRGRWMYRLVLMRSLLFTACWLACRSYCASTPYNISLTYIEYKHILPSRLITYMEYIADVIT